MLDIKAEAMDPLAAAEVIFEQAAEGRFYLLTQPDYVGSAMAERAECLPHKAPRSCGPSADSTRGTTEWPIRHWIPMPPRASRRSE